MPDPLYDAIEQALAQPLDGTLFEPCAVDLLRAAYYPDLRATPQYHDAGVDGFSGPDAEPDFILVATTQADYARNLRKSIKSYMAADGPGRRVVLATTREVTGARRLKLQKELMDKSGVQLHAVHDRGEFTRLLYDHPQWRRDLLGVPGAARALSRFSANARPIPAIPLIGRDEDLQQLRKARGDILLVGRPGVGKTFLLERLASEDCGLFDAGRDIADLEDAVRDMQPQRIVIDDAHLAEGRLAEVRWLRREMGVDFDIVAVSWPGQADVVQGSLPGADRVDVEELERDKILQVITEVGVAGPPDLQRLIVNQAHGCAGLAVTLASACVDGRVGDVATGDALLDDLARWYERTLGSESRQVLGVLALAGDRGATLEQAREILGLSPARGGNLVRGLASGGTIDDAPRELTLEEVVSGERPYRRQRMRVQPDALRFALVRDVFFGGPGALDPAQAIACLDHPSIASIPLIGAAHRGAAVNRGLLQSTMDWTDERAATEYAGLGPAELRTALEEAPAHRLRIAEVGYCAGVEPEIALETLMELAVGDTRLEHSAPDHALRIVGDYLAHPDTGIEERRLAVNAADAWLGRGGDSDVGLRVLMHAVGLEVSDHSLDPGLGNTVTIMRAAVPSAWIEELSVLWDSILTIVEREPGIRWASLIDALRPWVYPGMIGLPGSGPDEEAREAIREVATRVITRLADILKARPGVLRRLQEYAGSGELPVSIAVPDDFATLFPERWDGSNDGSGFDEWERRNRDRVKGFANEIRHRSADDIAALITGADAEANAAGIDHPRCTPLLAWALAENEDEPETLLAALDERGASPDLILPLLDRTTELQRPGWEIELERLLAHPGASGAAARVALVRPCDDRLKRLAIQKAAAWLPLIRDLVFGEQLDHATLALLFDAPDALVRREAAVTLGTTRSGERLTTLPASMLERWREIIVASPAGDGLFSEILKRDPELCADWLRAWFERARARRTDENLPQRVRTAVSGLPMHVRSELIGDVPSGTYSYLLESAVRCLVSEDLEVAAALFERSDLADLHRAALSGGPNEAWMSRALLALDRGWSPERIAEMARYSDRGWSGPESQHWERKIKAFEDLGHRRTGHPDDLRRERIIAAAIALFGPMRDDAKRRERLERVFGRDR